MGVIVIADWSVGGERILVDLSLYPTLIPLVLMKASWRREGQDRKPKRKNPQGQNNNKTEMW